MAQSIIITNFMDTLWNNNPTGLDTDPISINGWCQLDSIVGYGNFSGRSGMFASSGDGGAWWNYYIPLDETGHWLAASSALGGGAAQADTAITLNPFMFTVVIKGNNYIKLYLDTELVDNHAVTGALSYSGTYKRFSIGGGNNTYAAICPGKYQNFTTYSGELTQEDIDGLYAGNDYSTSVTRTGQWDLNGNLNDAINGNHLTASIGGESYGDPIAIYDQPELLIVSPLPAHFRV
jgi:hypothetical protein